MTQQILDRLAAHGRRAAAEAQQAQQSLHASERSHSDGTTTLTLGPLGGIVAASFADLTGWAPTQWAASVQTTYAWAYHALAQAGPPVVPELAVIPELAVVPELAASAPEGQSGTAAPAARRIADLQWECETEIARTADALDAITDQLDDATALGTVNGVTVELDGARVLQSVHITPDALARGSERVATELVAASRAAEHELDVMINNATSSTDRRNNR